MGTIQFWFQQAEHRGTGRNAVHKGGKEGAQKKANVTKLESQGR